MLLNYPIDMSIEPEVTPFFDEVTNTVTYIVKDPESKACAVIDSVMDFDQASGRIGFEQADKAIAYIRSVSLEVQWIIETHVHADRKSTRLNSSHSQQSRMPSSA